MAERSPIGRRSIAAAVAAFECRLQIRSPVFAIVVAIAGLMVVGSLTVERIQVGPLRPGARTSVEAILYVHLVWSLFFLFTAAAFAAEAALRDEAAGFDAIVRATPARRRDLNLGRLAGALACVLASFASVPVAAALAPFAPWSTSMLPQADPAALAYGTIVLAVPNLMLATAVFFWLAAATRRAMAAYLGAVALLVLYGLGSGEVATTPSTLRALADPFGFAATASAMAGWGAAQRAGALPPLDGVLGLNRVVWLGIAGMAFVLAARTGRIAAPPRSTARETGAGDPAAPFMRAIPPRRFGPGTTRAQLAARTRLEAGLVARSPFLLVLLLLGLASVAGTLWPLPAGTPGLVAMARVDEAFRLVPIVVATFWAGELVWSERDHGVADLLGASAVPDAIILAPKVLALFAVLAASIGSVALGAAAVSAIRGGPSLSEWWLAYGLPKIWDAWLFASLALFLQALAPGKLAGFGLMVLVLIGSLALESAGFQGDLYRYGGGGTTPDVANAATGHALLVRAYWGAAAALLLVIAHQLVGRGTPSSLPARLRRLPGRLRGGPGRWAAAAALAWAIVGVALVT